MGDVAVLERATEENYVAVLERAAEENYHCVTLFCLTLFLSLLFCEINCILLQASLHALSRLNFFA